ncbi:Zn-dependent alcohol dehydrogenase [Actibacterium sp. XHP0104]|uniref:Zn-dependent alcohol dehydrogenase n=1 Tax=Actibacterium sp. XHP0104 TaxID=2984335 RepID=UPI0021E780FE|nr:Zn-dependent alcohol dehydrogenase [Actibacterium sp. XHP0104]MCV2882211.1 Zn-dependent alcohol dehydrogenase [Actibacterium sp. XHP0104]
MVKIRAAVCHEFNAPLRIEEVELRAPGPGEVEVTLDAVAVCHSDISYAEGAWAGPLPAVYGHEAAGRITAIGPGVAAHAMGDHVLVTMLRSCGACPTCATGHPSSCTAPAPMPSPLSTAQGGVVDQGLVTGAFAERVVVHHSQLAALPDDMPSDAACLLACGVITGIGAVANTAQVRPGQTVVVIGAGGVGLNAIQGARIAGAARIIAVDMLPEKLDAAREFGATDTILASEPKPWSIARRIAGRGADAVLVTVGAIPAYDSAPRYLAPGGRMVMVGMPHSGAAAQYEPVILARTGQGLIGSYMGDTILARDIPWMVDLYRQGRLKLDELISARWPLDQINEAIADTKTGSARRNVIVF